MNDDKTYFYIYMIFFYIINNCCVIYNYICACSMHVANKLRCNGNIYIKVYKLLGLISFERFLNNFLIIIKRPYKTGLI